MVQIDMMSGALRSPRSYVRQGLQHPKLIVDQLLVNALGRPTAYWKMFDAFGPVVDPCPQLRLLGEGDEEKRICWNEDVSKEGCVVFSVGSNNQWTFEETVVAKTPCVIHTFDCTVAYPNPPTSVKDRVTFHKLCVGGKDGPRKDMVTYRGLVEAAGGKGPSYLKFDAEGFEYETFAAFFQDAKSSEMPQQIALEVHFQSAFFDLDEKALLAFSNMLFIKGGYVIVHRRDNVDAYTASELLFAKVSCS